MINHWAGPGGLFFPLLEALPSFAFQKRRRRRRSHFFPFSYSIFFPWRSRREETTKNMELLIKIFGKKHILSNWKTVYYMKVSCSLFYDFFGKKFVVRFFPFCTKTARGRTPPLSPHLLKTFSPWYGRAEQLLALNIYYSDSEFEHVLSCVCIPYMGASIAIGATFKNCFHFLMVIW